MEFEPELKPLYANLKRLKVGDFLATREFELFILENNLDRIWSSCKREVTSRKGYIDFTDESTEDEEEAFMYFISAWYDQQHSSFHEFILPVLINFAKWYPTKLDYTGIIASLRKTDISDSSILGFAKDFKKIKDGKPEKTKETKLKLDKTPKIILNTNKIFVVHGHDDKSRLEICNILKDDFKLEPIVLQEKPNNSIETVITKFERLASDCSVAIVLFTPDDVSGDKKRARQNVIFELGYFLGKFQEEDNRKIIILKKGAVEIPSDISGVIYFEYNKAVKEIFYGLKKQLEHWGYNV
jgi:predicted nucleotide-binding protein